MRRGVGVHGSAQERAEAPGLGLGELSHALRLERSCLHGGLGDTREWMHSGVLKDENFGPGSGPAVHNPKLRNGHVK